MFLTLQKVCIIHNMLVTGIILAPLATATITPAVQDLVDLRGVINAAASSIGDPNNPNRGFGFNLFAGSNQMGTADLVNNITNTILRGKFQLDTNKVRTYHIIHACFAGFVLTSRVSPDIMALPSRHRQ